MGVDFVRVDLVGGHRVRIQLKMCYSYKSDTDMCVLI